MPGEALELKRIPIVEGALSRARSADRLYSRSCVFAFAYQTGFMIILEFADDASTACLADGVRVFDSSSRHHKTCYSGMRIYVAYALEWPDRFESNSLEDSMSMGFHE
jgi:hypothetical protein